MVLMVVGVLFVHRFTRFVKSKDIGEFVGDPQPAEERAGCVGNRAVVRQFRARRDSSKPAA
jgi:hypothetical protein